MIASIFFMGRGSGFAVIVSRHETNATGRMTRHARPILRPELPRRQRDDLTSSTGGQGARPPQIGKIADRSVDHLYQDLPTGQAFKSASSQTTEKPLKPFSRNPVEQG
jgi:hypothetical protein